MTHLTYPLQEQGSLSYARMELYIQEYSDAMAIDKRPLILLCPGGGYGRTSDRESEPMALKFLAMGYHAAILRYSCAPAQYPTALFELARAMTVIRTRAGEWHIDSEKVVVQGCSAGGHLAASLGMFWDEDFVAEGIGLTDKDHEILRPYGMVLCYPVVTSGEFAHKGSFEKLIGDQREELKKELLEKLSLENQVSSKTPKAFIWHTFTDQSVPVENSLLLVGALRKAGISTEFHMYPTGEHGLALANHLTQKSDGGAVQEECSTWINLAETWLKNLFTGAAE
ncbi:MAG: alpha/beta hydrolase [Bacteroidales bacterium]|nr:alpha/beta hydrolase [Lachnoclostridium sp.]MCM1384550.1 alpha/beta hydrolase [Lachnoclostridium sp.]MCM1465168.1 alpha/beta hydrolase [Bacteroidales bacterium]